MTLRSGATLGRLIQRAGSTVPGADERCELCGAPLPERHRHVLDEQRSEPLCACQACTLLFERPAAGRGHYRLVPERRVRLEHDADGPPDLGVPVGLAFFVVQPDGAVVANYPSPVGATRWELAAQTWAALVARWPALGGIATSVEALLVNTARGHAEHWLVPIDDCYRLVAVVRGTWKGMSGGREVWPAIDAFFAGLAAPPQSRLTIGSR